MSTGPSNRACSSGVTGGSPPPTLVSSMSPTAILARLSLDRPAHAEPAESPLKEYRNNRVVATPRLQKPPHPHPYPTSPEATFIPISMLVRFVLAKGINGIIEASATYRFSIPCTPPRASTTDPASDSGPILHVPDAWL